MAVLLLLAALVAPGFAQSNSYSYCPPSSQCDCDSDYFQTSYIPFASAIRGNRPLDNACHTFFETPGDPCTYDAYFGEVYTDGTSQDVGFKVTCNSSDQYIYASPDCTFLETRIGSVGQLEVFVRSLISGDCPSIFFPVLVRSPCPGAGSSSDLNQISQMLSSYGYGCTTLYDLQERYSYQCVTSQSSSNTGSTASCPSGPCYGSDYDYDNYYPSPSYSYSPPSYSYSPPSSGCGCSK